MPYIVKSGDTLSKIAKARGLTQKQLLAANPQFRENPDKLRIGDRLLIPGEPGAAVTPAPQTTSQTTPQTGGQSAATAPALIPAIRPLGKISEKFETSGKGPGVVSTGRGDSGGVSYGSYQMTSAGGGGTVKKFVTQPDFPFRDKFQGLKPGSPEFTAVWKDIAKNQTVAFQALQHGFIKKTHYDPLVEKILRDDGLDVNTRSFALRDVVWSTAVQHGGNTDVIQVAIGNVDVSPANPAFDEKLISAIYAERGRKKADGVLARFAKNSPEVQKGVARRFREEEKDALKMLREELAEPAALVP
ncbi:MAG: LysM peptidoglycan-binding domain-containing protein [Blastocatellia bacterium]